MVLRKQPLTEAARRAFGLSRDPFGTPACPEDVFLTAEMRFIREAMTDVALHSGGFLAVIGESGSGKTTLRDELLDRIARARHPVTVIAPYILGMEDSEARGKPVRAAHIAEAAMREVSPLSVLKSSPEARFRQLYDAMRDSSRSGNRHLLLIEEAHSLPLSTLKHLKRFLELKDGLRPLMSIILIGQPELEVKLSERNPEVREVVQRVEVLRMAPLDAELEPFLAHRFRMVGCELSRVIEGNTLGAVHEVLGGRLGGGSGASLLYPLAAQNLLAAAMNRSAELGAPRVSGDLVRSL
jgi:type II secretory pathway predicted ATPase ExeA